MSNGLILQGPITEVVNKNWEHNAVYIYIFISKDKYENERKSK